MSISAAGFSVVTPGFHVPLDSFLPVQGLLGLFDKTVFGIGVGPFVSAFHKECKYLARREGEMECKSHLFKEMIIGVDGRAGECGGKAWDWLDAWPQCSKRSSGTQINAFQEPTPPSSACLCFLGSPVSRPENLLRFAVCNPPISSVHFWCFCFVLEHSASFSRPFIENSPCSPRWIYWEMVCFLHHCISQYLYFAHWRSQDAFVPWRN